MGYSEVEKKEKPILAIGKKIGYRTILSYAGKSRWRVICECGKVSTIEGKGFKNGLADSCGCYGGMIIRFWKNVNKTDTCWIWIGPKNGNGYGSFRYRGKYTGAHRISFMLENKILPDGMDVLHSCDNPLCVRPSHLHLGTHDDNMKEKAIRGRAPKGMNHRNGRSVLRFVEVMEIRNLFSLGHTVKEINNKYRSVSASGIEMVCYGYSWKWIDDYLRSLPQRETCDADHKNN